MGTPSKNHQHKSVLITGCSSGIGLCVAKGLHERGYRVFATARKWEDKLKLEGAGIESMQLNLDDSISIRNAIKEITRKTEGTLYALFNNASYGQPGAVEDLTREAMRAQFETNLFGTLELTNLVIPMMRKQGNGRIIQNSSVLGFVAMKYRGAYNASKYALEGLTDTLRLELAGTNIHCSLIEPGPITSKFRENAYKAFKKYIDTEKSIHNKHYEEMEKKLLTEGPVVPFTLPPEAVLKKVIHALESARPKTRYYVTFPTYLFGYLRHILSDRMLDRILGKI